MPLKRKYVEGDYGQIHLRHAFGDSSDTSSANRPLFCLHMSPKSSRIFDRFMRALASDRQVIAADYPGFGESDSPPVEPEVTLADYARNMWAVADALELETIDLLGYHTGSQVAAEMVHQRPAQVGRIVMISAPVFTAEELAELHAYFRFIPLDEAGTRFQSMWQKVQEHAAKGKSLTLAAESFAENLRAGEHYTWGHRAAFKQAADFPALVSAITQRIDVINPGDDLQLHTPRIRSYLQRGDIHERPQWGHGFLDFDKDNAVADIRHLLALR